MKLNCEKNVALPFGAKPISVNYIDNRILRKLDKECNIENIYLHDNILYFKQRNSDLTYCKVDLK